MDSQNVLLMAGAGIVLVLAGVLLSRAGSDRSLRSLAMCACVCSVTLVGISVRRRSSAAEQTLTRTQSQPAGPGIKLVGIALVALYLLGRRFLYLDAIHGYHQAWPLYFFAAVAVAGVVGGGYIALRFLK